ncbi:MAG: ATP-binding protein [Calditrichaceae bacterium]|jgi:signal transduction histidine kinase
MKIRTRLSIWYFTVSFLIVSLISLVIYLSMHGLLYRTIDEDLEIFTDMIESSYNPMLGEFEEILFRVESAKRFQEVYLIVYDNRGRIEFTSPMTQFINFKIDLPTKEKELGFTRTVDLPVNLPVLKPDDEGKVTFRGIVRRMYYNNHPIGWIEAGLPITSVSNALDNLLSVIILVNGLAVLLVGLGGYFIIGKFLFPIKLITTKAREISHSNLNQRIKVQNEQDELGQLTLTLNGLLERLFKAFEAQRMFMADAAHELKTPLAVLRTHWENEFNNPDLNNSFKEQLVQDVETIARLNQMINKLIFLAQTEDVYEKLDLSDFQLDEFLREIIDETKILADLKKQDLAAIELSPVTIRADRNQLYQLFFNLLDNAIKYTPEGGKIWVTLQNTKEGARVKIRDNGIGMEESEIPRVFERFYRVDKDRARKSGGSGLGLSICKLIVDSHHGSISIDSKIKNGTTFTVIIPHHNI